MRPSKLGAVNRFHAVKGTRASARDSSWSRGRAWMLAVVAPIQEDLGGVRETETPLCVLSGWLERGGDRQALRAETGCAL